LNYAVFLMGENFPAVRGAALRGFFITKRIEAPDEASATALAIASVKADPQFSSAFSATTERSPMVTVKVVHKLPDSIEMEDTEYQFFPMEEP